MIGTSEGKSFKDLFDEKLGNSVEDQQVADLDKRTPPPTPKIKSPPLAPDLPQAPSNFGNPGQKLAEVRDLSQVPPKYNWGNNPPDFEADSLEDFAKHPRSNDWMKLQRPIGTDPKDSNGPWGWTVPSKPIPTSGIRPGVRLADAGAGMKPFQDIHPDDSLEEHTDVGALKDLEKDMEDTDKNLGIGKQRPPETLDSPVIRQDREAKINNMYSVPTGSITGKNSGTVYIDHKIPAEFHAPLYTHETTEAALMRQGKSYDEAHDEATKAEAQTVMQSGKWKSWKDYVDAVDPYVAMAEKDKNTNLPPEEPHVDYDTAEGHHRSSAKQLEAADMKAGGQESKSGDVAKAPGQERYQTWPERLLRGLVSGAVDFAKLPRDVYQGKVDPTSEEGIKRSTEGAMLLAGTGLPAAEKGAAGIFGGYLGAKNLPHKMEDFKNFYKMEQAAEHPDKMWRQTGFFRGADTVARFEIPDKPSILNESLITRPKADADSKALNWTNVSTKTDQQFYGLPETVIKDATGKWVDNPAASTTLEKVLDHPELYRAYPELKDMKVSSIPSIIQMMHGGGLQGVYNPETKSIMMNNRFTKPEDFKSTLLHEVQHAVQNIEGYARGGNTEEMAARLSPELPEMLKKLQEHMHDLVERVNERLAGTPHNHFSMVSAIEGQEGNSAVYRILKDAMDKRIDFAKKTGVYDDVKTWIQARDVMNTADKKTFEGYRRIMGEVEARNVQKRMDMNQFLRTHPESTEDVPRDKQIFVGK